VVDDGVTGFISDDLDGLVRAVARVSEIDRAACRARVERFFSDTAVTEAYLAIYRDMLAARADRAAAC
jgi:glycosyltransferase involved in cell wall biosynthesis